MMTPRQLEHLVREIIIPMMQFSVLWKFTYSVLDIPSSVPRPMHIHLFSFI